ncbi:MAG: DNA-binding protein [Devosia sp.]
MSDQPVTLDLLWGAKPIGEALGLTERQAKYMLANNEIPGRKVGGRWVASREALRLFFNDRRAA